MPYDWNSVQDVIRHLYVIERRELRVVEDILRKKYKFPAKFVSYDPFSTLQKLKSSGDEH